MFILANHLKVSCWSFTTPLTVVCIQIKFKIKSKLELMMILSRCEKQSIFYLPVSMASVHDFAIFLTN